MKKRFALVLSMLFCCSLFIGIKACAKDTSFTITSYDIKIDVDTTNVMKITETINTRFYVNKHGIYRKIPLQMTLKRQDGSQSNVTARISDIECSDKSSISSFGGTCEIKLGDKKKTIRGRKKYTISYTYDLGNDTLNGNDEFYFNLIGPEWTTDISNVTFTINLPKKFDKEKIGMTWGYAGSSDIPDFVTYRVDGTKITGKTAEGKTLFPGQALTMRIVLPDKYFLTKNYTDYPAIVGLILAILGILVSFLIWLKFGKDDPVVETVELTPPGDYNSAEIAFYYRGTASREDMISLLVYLANKGYLSIEQKKKSYTITKLKEYDGDNQAERTFFNGLFANGRTSVGKSDLTNSFYKTIDAVLKIITSKQQKQLIFEKSSLNKGWFVYILSAITLFLCAYTTLKYTGASGISAIIPAGLGTAAGFLIGQGLTSSAVIGSKITLTLAGIVFASISIFTTSTVFANEKKPLITYCLALALVIVMFIFQRLFSKRTPFGTEILGRIRGFKNYLHLAEKDRIEAMVNENPSYFYDLLPYAYVLGESKEWMKQFENLSIEPPEWYHNSNNAMFDFIVFNHFMNNTILSSAGSGMTSAPSSSGGGFSGGGGGGGGGGSW